MTEKRQVPNVIPSKFSCSKTKRVSGTDTVSLLYPETLPRNGSKI